MLLSWPIVGTRDATRQSVRQAVDTLRSVLQFEPIETDLVARRLRRATSVADLRRIAKRRLPRGVFDYVDGAAEAERSMARNADDFAAITFKPRVLRDVSAIDTSTTLLGRPLPLPVVFAPTGFTRMCDPEGELAVARAAARADLPYALSTLGTRSIEEVAAVSDGRQSRKRPALLGAATARHRGRDRREAADGGGVCSRGKAGSPARLPSFRRYRATTAHGDVGRGAAFLRDATEPLRPRRLALSFVVALQIDESRLSALTTEVVEAELRAACERALLPPPFGDFAYGRPLRREDLVTRIASRLTESLLGDDELRSLEVGITDEEGRFLGEMSRDAGVCLLPTVTAKVRLEVGGSAPAAWGGLCVSARDCPAITCRTTSSRICSAVCRPSTHSRSRSTRRPTVSRKWLFEAPGGFDRPPSRLRCYATSSAV